jgi:uncharacterized peroxidase-related enzyme
MTQRTDILAVIAGIEPDSPEDRLRRTRPDIIESTQATFDAIFESGDEQGLTRIECEAAALYAAILTKAAEIAAFHRARLQEFGTQAEPFLTIGAAVENLDLNRRHRAILRHTELLTLRPDAATQADIDALLGAGVTPEGIVTLAQLVAFVAFEARTIAALRAIAGGDVA